MTDRPFSVSEDYEQQIGQETYYVLKKSIDSRTTELAKQVEEENAAAQGVFARANAHYQDAEAAATRAAESARSRAKRPQLVAWLVAVAILVVAGALTLAVGYVVIIAVLGLMTGALSYYRQKPGVVGVMAFVGVLFAFVLAYFSNGTIGRYGDYSPNPLWAGYALLYLAVLVSLTIALYMHRRTREALARIQQSLAGEKQRLAVEVEATRQRVRQRIRSLEGQSADLAKVIPLWRAGGAEAEKAATILVRCDMTEDAGILRAHQRKLAAIRYNDQQVTDRAKLLETIDRIKKKEGQCPRCSAPVDPSKASTTGLIRCEYCSLSYQPVNVSRFLGGAPSG